MAVSILSASIYGQTSHICPKAEGKYEIPYLPDEGGQICNLIFARRKRANMRLWPYMEADNMETAMH